MTQFPVTSQRARPWSRAFAIINNPDFIAVVIVALMGLVTTLILATHIADGASVLFSQFQ